MRGERSGTVARGNSSKGVAMRLTKCQMQVRTGMKILCTIAVVLTFLSSSGAVLQCFSVLWDQITPFGWINWSVLRPEDLLNRFQLSSEAPTFSLQFHYDRHVGLRLPTPTSAERTRHSLISTSCADGDNSLVASTPPSILETAIKRIVGTSASN